MPEITLELHNHCAPESVAVPAEALLQRCCELALGAQKAPLTLEISLLEEDEARAINQEFRGRDYATNVLSFPYEALPGLDLPLLGELILCPAVVAREAAAQGKALDAHWAHLVIHGCLHLLGHDHEEDGQAQLMEQRERELLAQLGYPDPYQDDE